MHRSDEIDQANLALLKDNEVLGKRKGGYTVHVVIKGEHPLSALCGITPRNTGSIHRAGWWQSNGPLTCQKCQKILDKRKE